MTERLQTTAEQRELLEKLSISSLEDLVYADLRRAGWSRGDALYAAFRDTYRGCNKRQLTSLTKQMEEEPGIKARINADAEKHLSTQELSKETSKEKVLSDLVLAKKKFKEGTKEWIDLTKMIADYTKIKQDDTKIDEQPIRYYIPENYPKNCKECLINSANREKNM